VQVAHDSVLGDREVIGHALLSDRAMPLVKWELSRRA
jgi:hypothetical protein